MENLHYLKGYMRVCRLSHQTNIRISHNKAKTADRAGQTLLAMMHRDAIRTEVLALLHIRTMEKTLGTIISKAKVLEQHLADINETTYIIDQETGKVRLVKAIYPEERKKERR